MIDFAVGDADIAIDVMYVADGWHISPTSCRGYSGAIAVRWIGTEPVRIGNRQILENQCSAIRRLESPASAPVGIICRRRIFYQNVATGIRRTAIVGHISAVAEAGRATAIANIGIPQDMNRYGRRSAV